MQLYSNVLGSMTNLSKNCGYLIKFELSIFMIILNVRPIHHVEYGFHLMSVGYMFILGRDVTCILLKAKREDICFMTNTPDNA